MNDFNKEAIRSPASRKPPGRIAAARQVHDRSHPLASMVLLTNTAAATLACINPPRLYEQLGRVLSLDAPVLFGLLLSIGVVGMMGFFLGLGQQRRWRNALSGLSFGGLSGMLMLAVYSAPAPLPQGLGAAALLLVASFALRARAA